MLNLKIKNIKYILLVVGILICGLPVNAAQKEDCYSFKNNKFVLYQYDSNGVSDNTIVASLAEAFSGGFDPYQDAGLILNILKNRMHNKPSYLVETRYNKSNMADWYYVVTAENAIELFALKKDNKNVKNGATHQLLNYTKVSFVDGEKGSQIVFEVFNPGGKKKKIIFTQNSVWDESQLRITSIYFEPNEIDYRKIKEPYIVHSSYDLNTYEFSALKEVSSFRVKKSNASSIMRPIVTGIELTADTDPETLDFVSRTDPFVKEAALAHKQYLPQLMANSYKLDLVRAIKYEYKKGK